MPISMPGGQSKADAFALASALDWMVQNHVAMVNVSLAGDNNALMALAVKRASPQFACYAAGGHQERVLKYPTKGRLTWNSTFWSSWQLQTARSGSGASWRNA
jgi:hypothetical protein